MRGSTRCCSPGRWNDARASVCASIPKIPLVTRRLLIAVLIAAGLAPGTVVRTHVREDLRGPIAIRQVAGPQGELAGEWQLRGVWEYDSQTAMFGGYSALLLIGGDRLRAFSDRGTRLTISLPDGLQKTAARREIGAPARRMDWQPVEAGYVNLLWDIESATRDPATGQYWLGFENTHAVQRYSAGGEPSGVRLLKAEVDWPVNSGAEAMARLSDGRFVIVPEGGQQGLIFPADPATGVVPTRFEYRPAIPGFAITDAAQLPDGRLLLLLRKVGWGLPPFESRIAIADVPQPGAPQVMRPQITLNLTRIAPRENYEGLAVRPRSDGALDVWLISDDNLAAMQRTLVVKLRFDPTAANDRIAGQHGEQQAKQKARE